MHIALWQLSFCRDVQNSNFISVWIRLLKKLSLVQNEFGSVQFEKLCSDIVVIYYLCNTWVVNLQQILQRYCAVLNELCRLYDKLGFGRVLKRSLSAHWMQVKLFLSLLIWTVDCTLFLSENRLHRCQIFGRFGFFYIRSEFLFSAHP